jgi:hypothetical protein
MLRYGDSRTSRAAQLGGVYGFSIFPSTSTSELVDLFLIRERLKRQTTCPFSVNFKKVETNSG